jgi:hypothetical protein
VANSYTSVLRGPPLWMVTIYNQLFMLSWSISIFEMVTVVMVKYNYILIIYVAVYYHHLMVTIIAVYYKSQVKYYRFHGQLQNT